MAQKRIKVKPGKTQSKLGFGVGIIFVIIGCVLVIPTFGPFGILWTAVAGFIAYSHYKNAFTNEGMATHEIVIDENVDTYGTTETTTEQEDIEEKLKKLESLYNQGLITHAEYEQKRKEIIDRF